MTVLYGFYNSLNNDRNYDSVDISRLFDGLISDGVFATYGGGLLVSENSGMQVVVSTGRAWFDHTWTFNDSPLFLTVETSELLMSRIDTLILEINTTDAVRANTVRIVKGTPGSTPVAPTLIRANGLYQYPLADIFVAPTVTTILQANITNRIGTTATPFVTGIIDTIAAEDLISQWHSEFDIWFDEVKDQLTTDAAGNLQMQINTLNNTIANLVTTPVGSIMPLSNPANIPSGWIILGKTLVSRTAYPNLFAHLGTIYGPGDGSTTFSLPSYKPFLDAFRQVTSLPQDRYAHAVKLLNDGRILLLGGKSTSGVKSETYFGTISGNTITWVSGTALPAARYATNIFQLSDGRILVVGGADSGGARAETYFGTISGNTITWVSGTALPAARYFSSAELLSDGRVLNIGGFDNSATRAETYFGTISGNTITWVSGTALPLGRYAGCSELLHDGRVLYMGGATASTTYFGTISGNTITWVSGTALPAVKYGPASAILPDGKVLLIGGFDTVASAACYFGDISGNTILWEATTSLPSARYNHKEVLLPDGRIYTIGGNNGSVPIADTILNNIFFGGIKT
jgi:hypothetical protein